MQQLSGRKLEFGVDRSVQLLNTSDERSDLMVGLGPSDVNQTRENYSVSGCHMLSCHDGDLFPDSAARRPHFVGKISAPGTVGVRLEGNEDVFFIVNGVKLARAFSVPVEQRTYHLLVLFFRAGDRVMIL